MMFEEWWGRTFERRGTVRLNTTPGFTSETVRMLPTEDVLEMVRSEDTQSVAGLLCHMEIRRREQWTARTALVVSIVALVVAAI